jgi:hypothetical protein
MRSSEVVGNYLKGVSKLLEAFDAELLMPGQTHNNP